MKLNYSARTLKNSFDLHVHSAGSTNQPPKLIIRDKEAPGYTSLSDRGNFSIDNTHLDNWVE